MTSRHVVGFLDEVERYCRATLHLDHRADDGDKERLIFIDDEFIRVMVCEVADELDIDIGAVLVRGSPRGDYLADGVAAVASDVAT